MYYREIYFFMKGLDFPIFKTKIEGQNQKFRLEEPAERRKYFDFKAGAEIEKLRDYLRSNTLLPTEFILALVERKIDQIGRKAIFIDGFPRDLDQISYSLYFRSLIGYREDPAFFTFISLP